MRRIQVVCPSPLCCFICEILEECKVRCTEVLDFVCCLQGFVNGIVLLTDIGGGYGSIEIEIKALCDMLKIYYSECTHATLIIHCILNYSVPSEQMQI